MSRPTLYIDVDGVIRDVMTALREHYLNVFPSDRVLPITQWNIRSSFPDMFMRGDDIMEWWFDEEWDEVNELADPYPGALEGMLALVDSKQYNIFYATSQPHLEAISGTWDWLWQRDLLKGTSGVIFITDKWHLSNGILLDDSPNNLIRCAEEAENILPVCMNQPWNTDVSFPPSVVRVGNFEHFVKKLQEDKWIRHLVTS